MTGKKFTFYPIFAICLLTAPFTISGIANSLLLSVILSILVFAVRKLTGATLVEKDTHRFAYWIFFAAATYSAVESFVKKWLGSAKLLALLKPYQIAPALLLWCIGIGLGIFAFMELNTIYRCIRSFLKGYAHRKTLTFLCAGAVFCLMQSFQLNFSANSTEIFLLPSFFPSLCMQILLLFFFCGILAALFRNVFRGFAASAILSTAVSIVNHYVTLFHGKPLYLSELPNMFTALNVISEYTLSISFELGILILFGVTLLVFIFDNKPVLDVPFPAKQAVFSFILSSSGICAICVLLLQTSVADTVRWSWSDDIKKHGYAVCAIKSVQDLLHPFREFAEYDIASLALSDQTEPAINETGGVDLILILNESFCDLEEFAELNPDSDPLDAFYDIPGAVYGYSYSSDIGGSTNNSEFELLTSHSMYLLNNDAPFNYINFNTTPRDHVVSYLKQFDYLTTAMHCGQKENYSRDVAYPQMGFDSVFLGLDEFTYGAYGNRVALDSLNYQDLIAHYHENYGKNQFLYLLTFQNHGGYTQNSANLDTVHIQKNYGALSGEINEYLTSVKMSADAFRELTAYFTTVDRPVVICMVGDHAPSFIEQLTEKRSMTEQELQIAKRKVPFVLWSNHEAISLPDHIENASMVDLIPLMLQSAGLPLSPYYAHILRLNEAIPIRLRNGIYQDASGIIDEYASGAEQEPLLTQYYSMEYNALRHDVDYRRELFCVK